jgi:Tfp pilus assembly protein PilF
LPMAGLLLVIADALLVTVAWCRDRSYERKARIAGTAIIASLVLATGVVAHHKAELWKESAVFWRDVVRNLPTIGPEREKRPYVHCFLNLGLGYEKAGKISDAVQAYERALEVDPQDAASLVILAKAFALSQNIEGASLLFNRALALKSPGAEDRFLIHFQYASFLDSNHAYDEALHHYQEALKTGKQREKVYHNMGIVMKQKGLPVEALTYFSRAAEASPQFGEPRLEMAKIYFSRGRFEEALAQCIQAQKLGADCRPDLLKKSIMEKLGQRIGQ